MSTADPATAGGRRLTVDDVLQIKVVNQPDLDTTARVETDGTINFPYVGRIKAAGRTQDAVSAAIADMLRKKDVVKEPQVLVEIGAFGAQATVQGAVGRRGGRPGSRHDVDRGSFESWRSQGNGWPCHFAASRCEGDHR